MNAVRRTTVGLMGGGNRARGLAVVAGAASVFVLVLAGGCTGPGTHTTEKASAAKKAVDTRKAAMDWDQARQSFLAGDLDKAMKLVDQSIGLRSEVPKSWVLRGRILMEKGNLDDAAASLEKAQAIDPDFAEARYYLGIVMERFSQPEKALEEYSKAAELEPSNAQYVIGAAEMMIDLNRLDEAETYLATRSASFEHNAGVRQTRGHLAMIRGDAPTGVQLFNEACLLAPDDKAILEDLVRAQIATSQFAEAEFNLSRLVQEDADNTRRDLQHMRVRCLVEVDRLLEAREQAIKLTQGAHGQADVQAWIELGNISFMLNDMPRARQAAARVISIAPDRTEGYMISALALRHSGNAAESLGYLRRAAAVRPEPHTYLLMAMVQRDLGNTAEARVCLDEALKLDPNDPAAQSLLAQVQANVETN